MIVYYYPEIFYLELKSIHGNTFPLGNLTQYEKLLTKKGIKGARPGVLIWFIDHDKEIFVPIESFERIKNEGYKSINIKSIDIDEYGILLVPTVKKRVFLDSDFRALFRGVDYYEKVNE